MENLIEKLQNNALFRNVDLNRIDAEVFSKGPDFHKEGEVIYSNGEEANSIYLLLSGLVNLIDYDFVNRGRNTQKSCVIESGDFFGYEEISTKSKRKSTTITLTHSEIFTIDLDTINRLIKQNIRILENLSRSILKSEPIDKPDSVVKEKFVDQTDDSVPIPPVSFKGKADAMDLTTQHSIYTAKESDLNKLRESLEREKQFAEKAIEEEMLEISRKEEELKKLGESLLREKSFAEKALSEEFDDLQKKEEEISYLEKSIARQKIEAQKLIEKKLDSIRQKDEEINKKYRVLDEERRLLDDAINKTKILAEKEIEILKRAKELEKEKAHIDKIKSKEEDLKQREKEIEQKLDTIEKEKIALQQSIILEQELKKKESELINRQEALSIEQKNLEIALEKENQLKQKEEDLQKLVAALENEKKFAEMTLQKEIEDLSRKEKELKEREENLLREKELSEQTLLKEIEELEKLQKESARGSIAPTNYKSNETEKYIEELEQLRKREKDLLDRIQKLEKEQHEPIAETKEKIPIPELEKLEEVHEEVTETENEIKISGDDTHKEHSFNRNFSIPYQIEHSSDIIIILVNVSRCTGIVSANFKTVLSALLRQGHRNFIIDLTFCEFIDSTFLGAVVQFLKKLSYEGGKLKVIIDVATLSSSTLFLSGMDRVFNIFHSIDDAIKAFHS